MVTARSRFQRWPPLAALWLSLSCGSPPSTVADSGASDSVGRVFRLTHTQWDHTVVDLLGLPESPGVVEFFLPDPGGTTFDTDPGALTVSMVLWQQYQIAAESLAERVVTEPARFATVVPAHLDPSGGAFSKADRDRWIADFGRRAYRRPLSPAEHHQLSQVFVLGGELFQSGRPFYDGVQATVTAVLLSPAFLYRTEGFETEDGTLGPYELASRLSYSLWNTTPDAALLDAAEAGELDGDSLEEHVDRMLADPRGHAMVADLHRQLLHIDAYETIWRPSDYVLGIGTFEASVPAAMQQEVYAFVDHVVYDHGTVRDLFTSTTTFANADIGQLYGVPIDGDALVRVELDATERAGLLTMSGFLAVYADESAPNLIKRGAFINDAFLCADVPPAPAFATALPEDDLDWTLREKIEAHTSDCGGSCHNDFINPVGFATGLYDESGVFREWSEGSDQPIDATGAYHFADGLLEFDGAVELAWLMADHPGVHHCYVGNVASYLYGQPASELDPDLLSLLATASLEDQPIRDLIVDLVTDPAFRAIRDE